MSSAPRESPRPTVCVLMLAHNHASFVREAVESVWAQDIQGVADIRMLVHDDASTDGTGDLLEDLAQKSPVPMELIRASTNQFSEGWGFYRRLLESITDDYIAFLECDDYWVDPAKLRLQVSVLEANERLALCHHAFATVGGDRGSEAAEWPPVRYRVPRVSGVALARENFVGTLSVVLRTRDLPRLDGAFDALPIADYPVWALATVRHDIAFLDRVMGVYRLHDANMYGNELLAKRMSALNEARLYVAARVRPDERAHWLDAIARDWPLPVELERIRLAQDGMVRHLFWKLEVADGELRAMKDRAREAERERDEIKRALDDVLESPSWRLTGPLRRAKRVARIGQSAQPGERREITGN